MVTRDVGRLFFHTVPLNPGTARIHFATTQEIEAPYRWSPVVIVRLWRGKALVVGWWRASGYTEEEALMVALGGYGIDLGEEDSLQDPEVRQAVRENISKVVVDLDDEWTILDTLGVMDS